MKMRGGFKMTRHFTKGKKRFTCADCGARQYFFPQQFGKFNHFRMRCAACGSYYLDESKPGKEELIHINKGILKASEDDNWLNKRRS